MGEKGRKPKLNKKEREAIYADPELLAWARTEAEERKCTTSEFICDVLEEKKREERG